MKVRDLLFLVVGLLALAPSAHAENERYRYRLEAGVEHEVCQRMTRVFNTRFKTPWDRGWLSMEPVPKINGVPYDKVFERLPGIEYDKGFVFDMLLSKYPTSPEFEAVKWVETRGYRDGYGYEPMQNTLKSTNQPFPVLIARLDINNDGKPEWVIKDGIMRRPTRDDGFNDGGLDRMVIFDEDAFDPAATVIEYRKTQAAPWYVKASSISNGAIYLPTVDAYYQLRPFIYRQTTYVAGYRAIWHDKPTRRTDRHSVLPIQYFPDEEYMNILRVLPGGGDKGLDSNVPATKTETTCRIRMILQKKPSNRGGR